MVNRFCISFGLLILLGGVAAFPQGRYEKYIGKTYYLRHSLVLEGDTRVFRNDIQFESTDGKILNRATQVTVKSIADEADFSRVTFSSGGKDYHLLVRRRGKEIDRKALKLVFTSRPVKAYWGEYFCESRMETKADVIRCLGFPLSAQRSEHEGKIIEKLYYTCWYVGKCGSFDTYWIHITDGRITGTNGTI